MRRCLAGLLLARLAAGSASAPPPQTFSENLTVREREILVELPDNLAGERLNPGNFRVLVDDEIRETTRAEPATGEWTLVIYIDQVLARPGTIFYSGLALANRARELTRVGSVEVALSGSDGTDVHIVLAPTREADRVERTLVDLAAAARIERDRTEGRTEAITEPPIPRARRQLDRLATFLASRRPAGPHAVFLVADGADLPPDQAALIESKAASDSTASPAFPFRRTARLLAAYGWVAIPVPLRKEGMGIEMTPQRELEIFRQGSAPSGPQNGVPPILPGRPPKKTALAFGGVIDLFVRPQTASLRVLARPTAGTVVGFEEQIGPVLAALPRRWRLWITEPDAPVDGRLHSLTVNLSDRTRLDLVLFNAAAVSVPGGTTTTKRLRAPEWIRSSSPEEIAEARLEALLDRRDAGGDLPLTVAAQRTAAGLELRLAIAPLQILDSAPPGPLRISWAWPGDGGAEAHHQVLHAPDLRQGVRHTVRIDPPPHVRQIAVVVEALGPERWKGAVVEAGP